MAPNCASRPMTAITWPGSLSTRLRIRISSGWRGGPRIGASGQRTGRRRATRLKRAPLGGCWRSCAFSAGRAAEASTRPLRYTGGNQNGIRWWAMSQLDLIPYSDAQLRSILERVRTIAMVGASSNWNRPSYFVMKYLQGKGYRVIPVNSANAGQELLGETVYASLRDIPEPVDMVDVFRPAR